MDAIRNNIGNLATKRGNRLLSGLGGGWGAALAPSGPVLPNGA